MNKLRPFTEYLYKDVKATAIDGKIFEGTVESFGGSVQGEEEYHIPQAFIIIINGGEGTVLFEDEIKDIEIL